METQSPEQSEYTLDALWANAQKRVVKLAILQNGLALINPETVAAWREGDFKAAIQRMYQNQVAMRFNAMTAEVHQRGVRVVRAHIIDERIMRHTEPGYLDLLIETFRRRNVPIGKEEVYLLPRYVCDRLGLMLPLTDTAIFDDNAVVVTHYNEGGMIAARDIYQKNVEEDAEFVATQQAYTERLLELLDHAHKLQTADPDDMSTWRDTVGAGWLS